MGLSKEKGIWIDQAVYLPELRRYGKIISTEPKVIVQSEGEDLTNPQFETMIEIHLKSETELISIQCEVGRKIVDQANEYL